MKKYKVSEEQVLEEAGKFGMVINVEHFVAPEADSKRGRPKVIAEKVSEAKGPKGRPKKSKKVLEIAGEEHEDLFAAMVANAQEAESSDDESVTVTKKKPSQEDKAEKAAKLAAEKAEKETKLAAEKAEKDAKLAAEKAEKEAKKAAEKAEKDAKLAAEKEQKAAKLAAEKAEKESKKAALEAEKEAKKKAFEDAKAAKEAKKKAPKKAAKEEPVKEEPAEEEEEEEEEQVKVDGVKVDGKKYYRSTTGIMYDYHELKVNQNQVVVGKWNEAQQKIDFAQDSDSELEEEEEEDN
jgi:hypothetical protein